MKKKWLIAAVCVLMLVLTACGGGQGEETTDAPAETTAPAPQLWERNILRNDDPGENGIHYSVARDGFELRDEYPYYVFDSEYRREQIRTIRILDTLTDAPEDAWDVSEAGNGAVLAWVEPSGELYDLYIGAEGGVNAPRDCTYLFFGYVNMEQIDFGNAFHTADVVFMDDMFLGCKSLSNLDLSSFDTSNVQEMPFMFKGCEALTDLILSNRFVTANANARNMFYDCPAGDEWGHLSD